MAIADVANGLVGMVRAGQLKEAVDRYYADDIVSIEAMGEMRETHGIEMVRGKSEWWDAHHEVLSGEVVGPFVNGDEFSVLMRFEVKSKDSGDITPMEEIAVYTVQEDKIVRERFFYGNGLPA